MKPSLAQEPLNQLFVAAHSYHAFSDQAVSDNTIYELYDLLKWGPTSMNAQPGRYLFLRGASARERLLPALSPGNVEKTRKAPLTVIIAHDSAFYEHLPSQFKAYDAKPVFAGNAGLAESTAFRNGTLQGAYLMIAARALGLDCGPMSGFDPAKVNAEFFPDGLWQANFLVNLGYGQSDGYYPRGPRLPFDDVARIL